MKVKLNIFILLLFLILCLNSCKSDATRSDSKQTWKENFHEKLPLLGHRNWILVVDKTFPLQNTTGTVVINSEEQLSVVLREVMGSVANSKHVKAILCGC